jgi:chaperone required for assembly of F1-ATPase
MSGGVCRAVVRAGAGARAAVSTGSARALHATPTASSQLASGTTTKVGRFYREVTVAPAKDQEGYHVLLDKRKLRTPAKQELVIPSDALA